MPASRSNFAMRLLVIAALAAVALADVSHLAGLQNLPASSYGLPASSYGLPASSYGVPQNSVTENFLRALPTSPSLGLNLPAFEPQNFNPQLSLSDSSQLSVVSSTPAPSIDPSLLVSSTPAPSLASLVSTTAAPSLLGGLGAGYGYTTAAPDLGLNSGFVSSTPAPNVVLTSGSQELLSPNFGFNNILSTAAPDIFSTPASLLPSTPAPLLNSGLNFGSGLDYNFGLNPFSTPIPFFGNGGLSSFDAGLNVHSLHGTTSGGSLNDAFGISSGPLLVPGQPQISKHVYFYAAPEDPEPARTRVNIIPPPPPKKNVRILFIKTPSPPAPAPVRLVAPPQNEEKTIVYVLVKKPEEQQDIEIQPAPSTEPSKPEVYFIKYNNHQEAEQAISQVQNGQESSAPQIIANTVGGGDIISSINKESAVTSLPPLVNYFQSTTAAAPPLFNYFQSTTAAPPLGNYFQSTTAAPPLVNYFQSTTAAPPLADYFQSTTAASPLFNYFQSTTAAPPINFGASLVGPGFDSGFIGPQLDNDISSNLISSGAQTSSLFSTGAPVTVSSEDIGLIGTSTIAPPVEPHVAYGPPLLKKK